MKKAIELSTLSVEELNEKRRKAKSTWIGLGIPMVIMVVVLIFLAIKLKNYALIAVGMGCMITLLPAFAAIAEIDKEIKKRSESNLS